MEKGLHERDRVGLQDFLLLENYQSEEAFIDNLRKRFQGDLIYVSIEKASTTKYAPVSIKLLLITDIHRSSLNISESLQRTANLHRG